MTSPKRGAEDEGESNGAKAVKTGEPAREVPSIASRYPTPACYDKLITIVVGEETEAQQTFQVHKGILTFYSGYFQGALEAGFTEAANDIILLPTEDAEMFGHLVHWLYSRQLPVPNIEEPSRYQSSFELYALADRRMIPLLMNEIINSTKNLILEVWKLPTLQALNTIYEHLPEGSGLRRFIMDLFSRNQTVSGRAYFDDWPKEALVDLALRVWSNAIAHPLWTKDDVRMMDMCQYHTHEEGVTCSNA